MSEGFKPGSLRGELGQFKRPKWFGAEKVDGRPVRPDLPPPPPPDVAPSHQEVASNTFQEKFTPLPNQRGKGGRPTKAQALEAGKATPARAAVAEVQAEVPPLFQVPPRKKSWEKDYAEREEEATRQDAEALLVAREERRKAIQDETILRKRNRGLAAGFAMVGTRLVATMGLAASELHDRVEKGAKNMTVKELRDVVQTTGTAVSKAQQALEAMARVERFMERIPLDSGEEKSDLADIDPAGALLILENLKKTLDSQIRGASGRVVEGVVVPETPDAD